MALLVVWRQTNFWQNVLLRRMFFSNVLAARSDHGRHVEQLALPMVATNKWLLLPAEHKQIVKYITSLSSKIKTLIKTVHVYVGLKDWRSEQLLYSSEKLLWLLTEKLPHLQAATLWFFAKLAALATSSILSTSNGENVLNKSMPACLTFLLTHVLHVHHSQTPLSLLTRTNDANFCVVQSLSF